MEIKGKFKRQRSGRPHRNTVDERGTVRVTVHRSAGDGRGGGHHKIGNITRSLAVHESKVSEVFEAIERALFDD